MNNNLLTEELGRIKSLFSHQKDRVISEQIVGTTGYNTAPNTPAPQKSEEQKIADGIVKATQGPGTNETNFLASLNKIKDSAQFWNVNSYLKTVGNKLDFAGIVNDEMDNDDGSDVQKIVDKLKSIGVGATADINEYNNFKPGSFKFTTAAPEQKANDRQTNINNVFCNVKGGVIILPNSKQNNVKWEDYKKVYKLNQNEILAAAKTCPNAELSKTIKKNPSVDVNSRFTKSASSLGIQNAKMDVQSLQTILNQLSGTQSSTVATGGQQPDLTTLQNAVTQLTNA